GHAATKPRTLSRLQRERMSVARAAGVAWVLIIHSVNQPGTRPFKANCSRPTEQKRSNWRSPPGLRPLNLLLLLVGRYRPNNQRAVPAIIHGRAMAVPRPEFKRNQAEEEKPSCLLLFSRT